jgi:cell division septum initiation protein DivIVA
LNSPKIRGVEGERVSIKPEEINAGKLPTAVRGYQREATENLLKLVAWDYRRALRDRAAVGEEVERLKQQNQELEGEVEALRRQLLLERQEHNANFEQRLTDESTDLRADNARLHEQVQHEARRRELTHSLLASAMRSAREAREETRLECNALIKSARKRAVQIEEEAHRTVKRSTGELDRLQKLERDLREQLRNTLAQVIGGEVPAGAPEPAPEAAHAATVVSPEQPGPETHQPVG